MERLLQKSKCFIFHNIFKYMVFQRRQKAVLWSKGLTKNQYPQKTTDIDKPSDQLLHCFQMQLYKINVTIQIDWL